MTGRVLITGAGGRVGHALVGGLRQSHPLRLHSRSSDLTAIAVPEDEVVHGDLTDPDQVRALVHGVTAIVHLAGEARADSTWDEVYRPNIVGLQTLLEQARAAQVDRFVFASTNHVTGQYDAARDWPISPDRPLAPDGIYAVSKAFGEALCSFYAWKHGLRIACLRIGWVLDEPHDEKSSRLWLSPGDLVELVHRALVADLDFGVFYGVSDLVPGRYDLTNARDILDYRPRALTRTGVRPAAFEA